MSDPKDWIAISLLPRVGSVTLNRLYSEKWTPEKLIANQDSPPLNFSPDVFQQLSGYIDRKGRLWDKTQQTLDYIRQAGLHCLLPDDEAYPALLREIPDRPVLLFIQGYLSALQAPMLALVGSRKPSGAGLRHAYQFSRELTDKGFTVVSGLALGVDGAAHQAAVDQCKPTIAVMGTGSKHIYPAKHQALACSILDQGGALVTEFLPDKGPLASNFPRRNRIISGMSLGTLVVEAAIKSGSLITARQALHQGREVFALPGSIDAPGSRGCHTLIREGAVLVENVEHIVTELGSLLGALSSDSAAADSCDTQSDIEVIERVDPNQSSLRLTQKTLLDAIGYAVTFIEELDLPNLGLVDSDLATELVELEMLGWIEPVGGGYRRVR